MAPAPADVRSAPRALRSSPGFLLGKAAQRGSELVEQALRPLELKTRHYGVLVSLEGLGALTQHELGQLLRIDRTTMVAIVDHLEQRRFVRRAPDRADRRANRIQLTAAGRAALRSATGAVATADTTLVEGLSAEERAELVSLLHKICALA
jgi:DNA-binding MarR family transcriptional regulator